MAAAGLYVLYYEILLYEIFVKLSYRADKLDVDIAMMQENMNSLLSNQMNLMKVSMDMETRKRESAIIKDLQKKMAAYSTDKVQRIHPISLSRFILLWLIYGFLAP